MHLKFPNAIRAFYGAITAAMRRGDRMPLGLPAPSHPSPDLNPEDCLDIPVRDNLIEPLHVLFTLYSEFQSNPHFSAV